ncbi:Ankyrin repeat domain-containing protein 50 [Purpureocillium lavendulum]|uniref:Ankyrin repeat domain-containing protein 50 n=1 Tax=Purpureocillium lavendulum TaxID=1247861 RepID=A0AB34FFD7_9HYPO|nr:Ankyrin repeat domain-containing protein 50 [Purpureocillium lavendulum]
MAASPTPPLLLTKRLNAFLHANTTPALPTLLLTTAHGKLLAHASPHAVALLRTHATVAASLLAIHTSSSVDLPSALPGARTPDHPGASSPIDDTEDDDDDDGDDGRDGVFDGRARGSHSRAPRGGHHDDDDEEPEDRARSRRRSATQPVKPVTITVQLSGGTVIIRRLRCGLLFVAIGPSAHEYYSTNHNNNHMTPDQRREQQQQQENGDVAGSPSEVESLVSAGGQTTSSLESVGAASVAMRRHAGDLARWLDDKLGTLQVPAEDGSIAAD